MDPRVGVALPGPINNRFGGLKAPTSGCSRAATRAGAYAWGRVDALARRRRDGAGLARRYALGCGGGAHRCLGCFVLIACGEVLALRAQQDRRLCSLGVRACNSRRAE